MQCDDPNPHIQEQARAQLWTKVHPTEMIILVLENALIVCALSQETLSDFSIFVLFI